MWKQNGFLIPPHPLTSFEIEKYYENEPRFNGIYSIDDLSKIKDGAYEINLSDIGTHWVALYINNNNNNDDNNNNNNNSSSSSSSSSSSRSSGSYLYFKLLVTYIVLYLIRIN